MVHGVKMGRSGHMWDEGDVGVHGDAVEVRRRMQGTLHSSLLSCQESTFYLK